jgi:hypothetical protein
MNAPLQHPVIPAGESRQETTCEKFGGTCCEWSCCQRSVTFRAPTKAPRAAYLDIEAMADLDAPLGSPEFFAQWHDASERKEADYLDGDDTDHRKAWEA